MLEKLPSPKELKDSDIAGAALSKLPESKTAEVESWFGSPQEIRDRVKRERVESVVSDLIRESVVSQRGGTLRREDYQYLDAIVEELALRGWAVTKKKIYTPDFIPEVELQALDPGVIVGKIHINEAEFRDVLKSGKRFGKKRALKKNRKALSLLGVDVSEMSVNPRDYQSMDSLAQANFDEAVKKALSWFHGRFPQLKV